MFVEKLKYFIFLVKFGGQWYQALFVNQNHSSEKVFFESGSNFISEMSITSVCRVVFLKTQLKLAQKFVLTQKLFSLVINNPFNNF